MNYQISLAIAHSVLNTRYTDLKKVLLQDWKKLRVQGVQAGRIISSLKQSPSSCVNPSVKLDTVRISGMENFSAITSRIGSAYALVSNNASVCFGSWDFAEENRVLCLPNLIQSHNAKIKKLRRQAARNEIDLWFENECHFQQHGSRSTRWIPPENIDPVVLHAPIRKGVEIFDAVRVDDGRFITIQEEKFNAMIFHLIKTLCINFSI